MDNQLDELPNVDNLINMAAVDPQGLEELRVTLCSQLIERAPKQYQKRLRGIQFQIDMERRKANNPMHSCIKISEMMLESYQKLQEALSELPNRHADIRENKPFSDRENYHSSEQSNSNIIDFKLAGEKT